MLNRLRLAQIAVPFGIAYTAFEASAHAQGWLADRKYSEGAGIRVGELELHPGIGAEAGYDSNYFQRSSKSGFANSAPLAPVEAAGTLRLTPSLYLSTMGAARTEGTAKGEPPKLAFRAGIAATYRAFLGSSDVSAQNGVNGLSGDLNARFDIMPQRPFSVVINGAYTRTVAPNASGNPDTAFNRNDILGGLDFLLNPGGGTLTWKLGYGLRSSLLDNSAQTPFNSFTNTITTRGEWRFRPKTSVFYDGATSFVTFTQRSPAFTQLNNTTPVRARLGFSSLASPRFSFLVAAGWGASFVDTSSNPSVQQFDSVIGQAEAKFFLTANPATEANAAGLSVSALSLGFTRDFQTSYLTSVYGSDRGYAKLSYNLGGRAIVALEGGVGAVEYPKVFFNGSTAPINAFTNVRADAALFGEYRFTNTVGLNTSLKLLSEISNQSIPVSGTSGSTPLLYDMNFTRFEAFLGVRWFM